jgi:hypothetical protein
LRKRFSNFGRKPHPHKTRLIEFGRFAAKSRSKRGQRKSETFNFPGFTPICAKTRRGKFTVLRKTIGKMRRAKLNELNAELWQRMHEPIPNQGAYLRSVVAGMIGTMACQ